MGRESSAGGVNPHRGRILLRFVFQGEKCRPTLDLPPTPPNLAYAKRLVRDSKERIRHGTFDLGKEFPNFGGLERFNAKHESINNVLSQARIVFARALKDGAIAENPAKKVEFLEIQHPEPDPFELEEVE